MSSQQNIKCGWIGCGHKFGSEIDMNMHVMMNHMILLEHGTFSFDRHNVGRKRALVREQSVELIQPQLEARIKNEPIVEVKPHPIPEFRAPTEHHQATQEVSRAPEIPAKIQRIEATTRNVKPFENALARFIPIPIPNELDIPGRSPWVPPNPHNIPSTSGGVREEEEEVNEDSLQHSSEGEQNQLDIQDQAAMMNRNPDKLSDIIDEIVARLQPMKQLGFIRPHKAVYCIVCLRYVKTYHECNWKHTALEDRIAEIWYRRFGQERPRGKHQLMKELLEIKDIVMREEEAGRDYFGHQQ